MKWTLLLMAALVAFGCQSTGPAAPAKPQGKPEAAWKLSGDLFAHDPTMVYAGGQYWLYYTGSGIQYKTSADGRDWGPASEVFPQPPKWWKKAVPLWGGHDVWAPDVSFYHGSYWMFYSLSTFGSNESVIGLAQSDDPASLRWQDRGQVIASDSSKNYNCIDPNLVIDEKGEPWLVFGSFWGGIFITALDSQTLMPKGEPVNIAYRPDGPHAMEAPVIVYHDGWYYLFTSRDACCAGVNSTYKMAVVRSKTVTGPYLDQGGRPARSGGATIIDRNDGLWIGPGGQSVVKDQDGKWILVHHAYDGSNTGMPTLRIRNLYFDAEGWPTYVKPTAK